MKRFVKVCTVSLVIVFVFSGFVLANSKPFHGTGLFRVVTADVLPKGMANIRLLQIGSDAELSCTAGISDNLEISLAFGQHGKTDLYSSLELKGRIMPESKDSPGLAVGIFNKSVYVVTSKRLDVGSGIRGHLGVCVGEASGPFIGVEKALNTVSVSRQNANSVKLPPMIGIVELSHIGLNVGVRLLISPEFTLDLALSDMRTLALGGSLKLGF
jgi:hypothetical protein